MAGSRIHQNFSKALTVCWDRIRQLSKMPPAFFTGLLNQATAQGTRSTVLRPLGWLLGILVTAMLGCIELKAPSWISIVVLIFLSLAAILYMGAFVYCLCYDRDALRSETYSI